MSDSSESRDPKENPVSPSNDADGEAMARLREGDDLALNDLMDRWRKPVLAYLYRTVGDYETAADLSQEVFVRIYRSRKKYKPGGRFSAYLFTIATNLAKNHFRWKKRHPEAELSNAVTSTMTADDPDSTDPSSHLKTSEQGNKIKAAVQRLPEKFRTPVILYHFNELPQAEIAEVLGCSEKAVESRLYRARKRLRKMLDSDGGS
jgi:RNA polymerase sigma-70 factor (ECF subfamily)